MYSAVPPPECLSQTSPSREFRITDTDNAAVVEPDKPQLEDCWLVPRLSPQHRDCLKLVESKHGPVQWPKTQKEFLIVEHTAHFFARYGESTEFRLKIRPEATDKFPFIFHDHPLHPFYQFIKKSGFQCKTECPDAVKIICEKMSQYDLFNDPELPMPHEDKPIESESTTEVRLSDSTAEESVPVTDTKATDTKVSGIGSLLSDYGDSDDEAEVDEDVSKSSNTSPDVTANSSVSVAAQNSGIVYVEFRKLRDDEAYIEPICWRPPTKELGLSPASERIIQEIGYELLRHSIALAKRSQMIKNPESEFVFLQPDTMEYRYFKYVTQNVIKYKSETEEIDIPRLSHSLHPTTEKYLEYIERLEKTFSLDDVLQLQKKVQQVAANLAEHMRNGTPIKDLVDDDSPAECESESLTSNLEKEERRKRVLSLLRNLKKSEK